MILPEADEVNEYLTISGDDGSDMTDKNLEEKYGKTQMTTMMLTSLFSKTDPYSMVNKLITYAQPDIDPNIPKDTLVEKLFALQDLFLESDYVNLDATSFLDSISNPENIYQFMYSEQSGNSPGYGITINSINVDTPNDANYTLSCDVYLSQDANNIPANGTINLLSWQDGSNAPVNLDCNTAGRGTWQHLETTRGIGASNNQAISLLPRGTNGSGINEGYIIYQNIKFFQTDDPNANNIYPQPGTISDFTVTGGSGSVNILPTNCESQYNSKTYMYDYSLNSGSGNPNAWLGINIMANDPNDPNNHTPNSDYIFSFDMYVSSNCNLSSTSTIASWGYPDNPGNEGELYYSYDTSKKGTWQHIEDRETPTSYNCDLSLCPLYSNTQTNKGYILYQNVKFYKATESDKNSISSG